MTDGGDGADGREVSARRAWYRAALWVAIGIAFAFALD